MCGSTEGLQGKYIINTSRIFFLSSFHHFPLYGRKHEKIEEDEKDSNYDDEYDRETRRKTRRQGREGSGAFRGQEVQRR